MHQQYFRIKDSGINMIAQNWHFNSDPRWQKMKLHYIQSTNPLKLYTRTLKYYSSNLEIPNRFVFYESARSLQLLFTSSSITYIHHEFNFFRLSSENDVC